MTARIEKGTFVQAWHTSCLNKKSIVLRQNNPLRVSRIEAVLGECYTYLASTQTGWKKIIQQTISGPDAVVIEPLKTGKGFDFIAEQTLNHEEIIRLRFHRGTRLKIISEKIDARGKNHQKSRIITAI